MKKNQPTLLLDLRAIDWDAPECVSIRNRRQGPRAHRNPAAAESTPAKWDGYADLPHAFRIQRQRTHVKTGASSSEVTYSLTSLSPGGPSNA